MAEETKKTTKKTETVEKMYSEAEVQRLIAEQVAKQLANLQTQPIVIKDNSDDYVTLLYMGAVAEGSSVFLGDKLGEIQGRGGTRDIPKKEFLQNITPNVLKRLNDRRLIVISGLTDDERERYNLNYKDGELLSADVYYKLLEMDADKIGKIFDKACFRHKQIIASIFIDAYMAHDNRVNQPLVQRLNEISKKTDKDGMFSAILKDMAKALADIGNEEE